MIISKNITVLADSFNPTIFNSDWLNKCNSAEGFKNAVIVPPLSVIKSDQYEVVCEIKKLQVLQNDPSCSNDSLYRLVKDIVSKLPHTPYRAIGINFIYKKEFSSLQSLRQFIFSRITLSPIPEIIESDDSEFTVNFIIKKELANSILLLKILTEDKPSKENKHLMIMDFNFHHNEQDHKQICSIIDRHRDYRKKAEKIVDGFLNSQTENRSNEGWNWHVNRIKKHGSINNFQSGF